MTERTIRLTEGRKMTLTPQQFYHPAFQTGIALAKAKVVLTVAIVSQLRNPDATCLGYWHGLKHYAVADSADYVRETLEIPC